MKVIYYLISYIFPSYITHYNVYINIVIPLKYIYIYVYMYIHIIYACIATFLLLVVRDMYISY